MWPILLQSAFVALDPEKKFLTISTGMIVFCTTGLGHYLNMISRVYPHILWQTV